MKHISIIIYSYYINKTTIVRTGLKKSVHNCCAFKMNRGKAFR